jgi:hypothetical protein
METSTEELQMAKPDNSAELEIKMDSPTSIKYFPFEPSSKEVKVLVEDERMTPSDDSLKGKQLDLQFKLDGPHDGQVVEQVDQNSHDTLNDEGSLGNASQPDDEIKMNYNANLDNFIQVDGEGKDTGVLESVYYSAQEHYTEGEGEETVLMYDSDSDESLLQEDFALDVVNEEKQSQEEQLPEEERWDDTEAERAQQDTSAGQVAKLSAVTDMPQEEETEAADTVSEAEPEKDEDEVITTGKPEEKGEVLNPDNSEETILAMQDGEEESELAVIEDEENDTSQLPGSEENLEDDLAASVVGVGVTGGHDAEEVTPSPYVEEDRLAQLENTSAVEESIKGVSNEIQNISDDGAKKKKKSSKYQKNRTSEEKSGYWPTTKREWWNFVLDKTEGALQNLGGDHWDDPFYSEQKGSLRRRSKSAHQKKRKSSRRGKRNSSVDAEKQIPHPPKDTRTQLV